MCFHQELLHAASPRLPSLPALSRTVGPCYSAAVRNVGSGFRQVWLWNPVLPLTSCEALDELLYPSRPFCKMSIIIAVHQDPSRKQVLPYSGEHHSNRPCSWKEKLQVCERFWKPPWLIREPRLIVQSCGHSCESWEKEGTGTKMGKRLLKKVSEKSHDLSPPEMTLWKAGGKLTYPPVSKFLLFWGSLLLQPN